MSNSFVTPWIVACQAPLSMGFPRQEYWSGLPFSSPGDFPDPEIKPTSPALAGRVFTTEPPGKPPRKHCVPTQCETLHISGSHPLSAKDIPQSVRWPKHFPNISKALGDMVGRRWWWSSLVGKQHYSHHFFPWSQWSERPPAGGSGFLPAWGTGWQVPIRMLVRMSGVKQSWPANRNHGRLTSTQQYKESHSTFLWLGAVGGIRPRLQKSLWSFQGSPEIMTLSLSAFAASPPCFCQEIALCFENISITGHRPHSGHLWKSNQKENRKERHRWCHLFYPSAWHALNLSPVSFRPLFSLRLETYGLCLSTQLLSLGSMGTSTEFQALPSFSLGDIIWGLGIYVLSLPCYTLPCIYIYTYIYISLDFSKQFL